MKFRLWSSSSCRSPNAQVSNDIFVDNPIFANIQVENNARTSNKVLFVAVFCLSHGTSDLTLFARDYYLYCPFLIHSFVGDSQDTALQINELGPEFFSQAVKPLVLPHECIYVLYKKLPECHRPSDLVSNCKSSQQCSLLIFLPFSDAFLLK